MSKRFHAGKAAHSGVLAAELASMGFTGPTQIYEFHDGGVIRITSYNVCYTKLLRSNRAAPHGKQHGARYDPAYLRGAGRTGRRRPGILAECRQSDGDQLALAPLIALDA